MRRGKASSVQEVRFLPRQGLASHREPSLAPREVTNAAKRRQGDQRAATEVKRYSPVTDMEQVPTVLSCGKATVGAGYGHRVGEPAGVEERGTLGEGLVEELGKPLEVSREVSRGSKAVMPSDPDVSKGGGSPRSSEEAG